MLNPCRYEFQVKGKEMTGRCKPTGGKPCRFLHERPSNADPALLKEFDDLVKQFQEEYEEKQREYAAKNEEKKKSAQKTGEQAKTAQKTSEKKAKKTKTKKKGKSSGRVDPGSTSTLIGSQEADKAGPSSSKRAQKTNKSGQKKKSKTKKSKSLGESYVKETPPKESESEESEEEEGEVISEVDEFETDVAKLLKQARDADDEENKDDTMAWEVSVPGKTGNGGGGLKGAANLRKPLTSSQKARKREQQYVTPSYQMKLSQTVAAHSPAEAGMVTSSPVSDISQVDTPENQHMIQAMSASLEAVMAPYMQMSLDKMDLILKK